MTDIVEELREGVWGRARRADAVIQAVMQEGADEIERLRNALAIADAACASYWEWEYGHDGDDIPNSSLLVAWRKDYETRTLPGEAG